MKQIEWQTDSDGMLIGAPIHDSNVVALTITRENIAIDAQSASGRVVQLRLDGVEELRIEELWEAPIILTAFVWKVDRVPESSWQTPNGGWNALFRNKINENSFRDEAVKIVAKKPELYLFLLDFSYGGQIAATCRGLTVFDKG